MTKTYKNTLKALIREKPHWIISKGTMIIAIIVFCALIASTQFSVRNIVVKELDGDFAQQDRNVNRDSLIAFFSIGPDEHLSKGQEVSLKLEGSNFKEYVRAVRIYEVGEKQASLLFTLPSEKETGEEMQFDCSVKAYVEMDLGETSVFEKLMKTLFHSIKI